MHAGRTSLGQAAGNTCAVANGKHVLQRSFQFAGQLEPCGIELNLNTAWAYAGSEDAIRQALVERYPRESFQLATKNASRATMVWSNLLYSIGLPPNQDGCLPLLYHSIKGKKSCIYA